MQECFRCIDIVKVRDGDIIVKALSALNNVKLLCSSTIHERHYYTMVELVMVQR